MSDGALDLKLRMLASSVDQLRRVTLFEKAKQAEQCLAIALDLLGELVDRIETMESDLLEAHLLIAINERLDDKEKANP